MTTRVLLVDKHASTAQRVAEQLIDYGCHVRVTDSGAQALKELEAHPYDLVLTEMDASPVRSLDLAKTIRKTHPGTRVIVTAGNGGSAWPQTEPSGLEMLFDDPRPDRLLNLLSARPGPRGTVLLVDDHLDEVAGLEELLKGDGYQVLTAAGGEEALELARNKKIEAAIIDFKMPGMSGWDTYKALKETDPAIRAVVVTGCSLDDYVQRCFDEDDVPVINKTFDPREMFGVVNASLRARGDTLGDTLLLVDEEASVRQALAEMFRSAGFLVQTAGRGESALALAREVSFDLAIVDARLPDMPGLELLRRLREAHFDAETVVLAANPDMDSAVQALHLKVRDYLPKPVRPEKLLDTVRRALRQRRLERQVRELAHELHHANGQLEELNRMKSRFLFIVAHDIRSPLSAVRGFAQYLLQLSGEVAPTVKHGLENILKGASHIGRLVEDLLDLGRMESGKLSVKPQKLEVAGFLTELKDRLASLVREADMDLDCDFSAAPESIEADPLRLEQILGNLVGNAIKHARRGKRVELIAAADGNALSLSVRDHGPGMTQEVLERVFEAYYQGKEDTSTGLGLGLSVVKELVESHGGKVWAESPGPGQGSTFRVLLPLRPGGLQGRLPEK